VPTVIGRSQNAAALRFAWHRRQEEEESMLASARFSAIVLIACSQSALSAEINWPEIAEQSAAMAWNCIKKRSDAALQVEASLGEMAQVVEALCKRELSLLNDGIYQASIADGKSQEQATKAAAEAMLALRKTLASSYLQSMKIHKEHQQQHQ
jgi:hypothetical protein